MSDGLKVPTDVGQRFTHVTTVTLYYDDDGLHYSMGGGMAAFTQAELISMLYAADELRTEIVDELNVRVNPHRRGHRVAEKITTPGEGHA